jgi:alpha-mannosidase
MYFIEEKVGKTCRDLEDFTIVKLADIYPVYYSKGRYKNVKEASDPSIAWEVYQNGTPWAERDSHAWFKFEVRVPEEYEGKSLSVYIMSYQKGWDATNPQFMVYLNGRPVQGVDVNHTRIVLTRNARPGDIFKIDMHAYSGMVAGQDKFLPVLAEVREDVKALYYDIKVPLDIIKFMDDNDKDKHDMLTVLNQTCNIIDFRKPGSSLFYESVKNATAFIRTELYEKMKDKSDVIATCVGHTHIDVAWLWTVEQTREKTGRSFSTVIKLMEDYPEYIFMSSQPQLYKFLKEDYPEVYEQVKEKVKEGRWEAEGGMWLEADCNVTSGESLVRQFLFGKTFFKNEFGVDNKILWLPDVFGYNAALPQIMKKCGIDYFMTTKINWNRHNKMPYDTFLWQGLDGTEVLTHFITTQNADEKKFFTTYNGMLNPSSVIGAWRRYSHKDMHDDVLISYGYGDGGGGPTEEMLENIRRMEKGLPGCPRTVQGRALDYFKRLEKSFIENKPKEKVLPKWIGELYLEYHRGTYTSMGRNKRANRKCELMLHDIETLYALLMQDGVDYPQEQINAMWENVLLNQFHDILPGSSIKEVYDVTLKEYNELQRQGGELIQKALNVIKERVGCETDSVIAVNTLGKKRNDLIEFESDNTVESLKDPIENKAYPVQKVSSNKYLAYVEDVPSKGYKAYALSADKIPGNTGMVVTEKRMENKFFDIVFNEKGNIQSIYDKVNKRNVLKPGQAGNVLQVFEDRPRSDENWNIEIYYPQKMYEIDDVKSVEVIEEGPVRGGIRIVWKFFDSTVTQNIYIYENIPRIDFDCVIDWKEQRLLLKTAFPVQVHAERATYDIQFGNIERTAHTNTSWDIARYEMVAHKWADYSQYDYGVALLNDCKYGHDIREGNMRLTLLKSGMHPNPEADKEVHYMKYSLVPHAGTWRDANIPALGYDFNVPMYAVTKEGSDKGCAPCSLSLFETNISDRVVMETVKKCEASDEYVIRLYECYNSDITCTLTSFKSFAYAYECNMLEENICEIPVDANRITFKMGPYEIKTLKVKLV